MSHQTDFCQRHQVWWTGQTGCIQCASANTPRKKQKRPKAEFDRNLVLRFRDDLSPEEVEELDYMLTAAFNKGLASGYAQGRKREREGLNAA